ncbi:MAG: TatD family hydrolase [Bacteroidales bacterium]|nr:TatD family hydrolase [Bacteroidales bacterium]
MRFVDTHTHLYDEAFGDQGALAVERAVEAGVTKLVFPDIDSKTRDAMLELADKFPGTVFPALGLHPTEVGNNWREELEKMESYVSRPLCAVGEIGLDFYWSKEFVQQQKEALKAQLELAHRLDLPVILHNRESTEAMLEIIKNHSFSDTRGVFHAFTGSIETFREIQKLGEWYVGIGGVATFKKASIGETLKEIPLDRILLETDSPYLTPVPHRGERNESAYIPLIADKIALQKGIDLQTVAEVTTENAEKLFKI